MATGGTAGQYLIKQSGTNYDTAWDTLDSTDVSDSTATGRSLLTAADAATARGVIGAGTSNLVIGTTSTTAKAGDYQPASTNITDSTSVGRAVLTAADQAAARAAIGVTSGVTPRTTYPYSYSGTLATATGDYRLYNDTGRTLTLYAVRASVGVAPTGASVIVDVNKNGTTIFTTQSNRPTIAASTNTDTADAIDVTTWAAGDYLTVDVDQVGSTIAGSDLTVTVVAEG